MPAVVRTPRRIAVMIAIAAVLDANRRIVQIDGVHVVAGHMCCALDTNL